MQFLAFQCILDNLTALAGIRLSDLMIYRKKELPKVSRRSTESVASAKTAYEMDIYIVNF